MADATLGTGCIRLTTALAGNGRLWEFGRVLRIPDEVSAEEANRLLDHRAAEVVIEAPATSRPRVPEPETETIEPTENAAERTRRPKGRG
jgi:hypothetical protein